MISREILDTSIAISLWKRSYNWYSWTEQRLIDMYHNSQTNMFTKDFSKKIKTCFRYSFLGRVRKTKQTIPAVLDNSRVAQYLTDFYKGWKDKIIYYLKSSSTVNLAEDTKEEFVLSSTKIIGIIIVTVILANVVLSIILYKQIGLWGWLMRGLFLFAGISGLFCQADWPTIKKNSIFLRKAKIN